MIFSVECFSCRDDCEVARAFQPVDPKRVIWHYLHGLQEPGLLSFGPGFGK
jgi:hypothetical protein